MLYYLPFPKEDILDITLVSLRGSVVAYLLRTPFLQSLVEAELDHIVPKLWRDTKTAATTR